MFTKLLPPPPLSPYGFDRVRYSANLPQMIANWFSEFAKRSYRTDCIKRPTPIVGVRGHLIAVPDSFSTDRFQPAVNTLKIVFFLIFYKLSCAFGHTIGYDESRTRRGLGEISLSGLVEALAKSYFQISKIDLHMFAISF